MGSLIIYEPKPFFYGIRIADTGVQKWKCPCRPYVVMGNCARENDTSQNTELLLQLTWNQILVKSIVKFFSRSNIPFVVINVITFNIY